MASKQPIILPDWGLQLLVEQWRFFTGEYPDWAESVEFRHEEDIMSQWWQWVIGLVVKGFSSRRRAPFSQDATEGKVFE